METRPEPQPPVDEWGAARDRTIAADGSYDDTRRRDPGYGPRPSSRARLRGALVGVGIGVGVVLVAGGLGLRALLASGAPQHAADAAPTATVTRTAAPSANTTASATASATAATTGTAPTATSAGSGGGSEPTGGTGGGAGSTVTWTAWWSWEFSGPPTDNNLLLDGCPNTVGSSTINGVATLLAVSDACPTSLRSNAVYPGVAFEVRANALGTAGVTTTRIVLQDPSGSYGAPVVAVTAGWHVYRVEWLRDGTATWYVDGVAQASKSFPSPWSTLRIEEFSSGVTSSVPAIDLDYVRAYTAS